MVFYLIGLGMNLKSVSVEALEIIQKCEQVYIENYTVHFPYSFSALNKILKAKIIELNREEVEKEEFLQDAKKKNIALLVYGSPLAATTHISLVLKCKKEKINYKVIQNASIFDSVSGTGLQMYKFGKTASMPAWTKSYEPDSFFEIVKENRSIKAHTLILIDIGLESKEAIKQLKIVIEKTKASIEKIIIVSQAGTEKEKIYYDSLENLKKKNIEMPFCFIIPSELHFIEKEALEELKNA